MMIAQFTQTFTLGTINANSVLTTYFTPAVTFKPNLPIVCFLDSADPNAWEAGLSICDCRYNQTGTNAGKIEFRVVNATTSGITPAAHIFHFIQLE